MLQSLVCRLCSRTAWGSPALSVSALLASFIRKLVVVLRLLSSGYCQRGTEVGELLSARRKWQLPRHLLQGPIITWLWLRLPRLSQTSQRVTQHWRLLHSQPSQARALCPHPCPCSDIQLSHSLPRCGHVPDVVDSDRSYCLAKEEIPAPSKLKLTVPQKQPSMKRSSKARGKEEDVN